MQALVYTADAVRLLIRIKIKKKHLEDVLQACYETIAPTHKEEGCLEYRLMHSDDTVFITGKWKDRMSLEMHLLLQFHLQLVEERLPALCKKIEINICQELEPPITALSLG